MDIQTIDLLLVEDNPGDARLVQEMLATARRDGSDNNFNIVHVNQLGQALTLIDQQQFDLILLDLSLPDSSGPETLSQMLNTASGAPIVVLSGLGDEKVAVDAVKAGAQDYLVKGYMDEFSLPRVISYAIERYRSQQDIERRNRELALLNKIIAVSSTARDPVEILEVACVELAKTFDLPQATATLFSQDKTKAEVVAQYLERNRPGAVGTVVSLAGNPLLSQIMTYNGPSSILDASNDPLLAPLHDLIRHYGIVSLLVLPVRIDDEVVGTLSLETTEPRQFSVEEVDLAWSVTDQIAGALARVRVDQERQLLSMAIEKTAESIIITDSEGSILYVNSAFEQTTGYTKAEVIGRNPRLLKSGEHPPEHYQDLWATVKAGQIWSGQFVNRKRDGSLYTEKATITPVCDAAGRVINYVAVKRDITQELRREEAYRQTQKMEAIGRLAGGIAHDFNNLLTVITGYVELLLLRYQSPDDPVYQDLEMIRRSSERAANLTRQLLTFSRKQLLEAKIINLNEAIKDIGAMLQRLIGEDIDMVTILAEDLNYIKADPGQIGQIVMNLAINARDAMPDGGQLTVETANVYLDEAYVGQQLEIETGHYVMLAVTDTGTGIDQTIQDKIFEPFFTTKKQDKGTGLGLATVYGIVKQSEGFIQVYSEPDRGATFKVYFPQAESSGRKSNKRFIPSELKCGNQTILIAEDDEMVRLLVSSTLKSRGYAVLEAGNGQEVLRICRQYEGVIDLLISDVIMPGGLSGPQLGQQVASLRPNMKVLFMSGYPNAGLARSGFLEEEKVDFLSKPFAPDSLTQKIYDMLNV